MMPIQPLDLQVMLSRLTQVGKEQADQKELAQVEQSLQGSTILRNAEVQTHSVPESRELGEGIEKSKADGNRKEERRERNRSRAQDGEEPEKEIITDPDLGTHIDLTG